MRRTRTICKALALCLIWSICCVPVLSALAESASSFYGTVVDGSSKPLSGVTVTAVGDSGDAGSTLTNGSGAWQLSLPAGSYTFQYAKNGYSIGKTSVSGGPGAAVNAGTAVAVANGITAITPMEGNAPVITPASTLMVITPVEVPPTSNNTNNTGNTSNIPNAPVNTGNNPSNDSPVVTPGTVVQTEKQTDELIGSLTNNQQETSLAMLTSKPASAQPGAFTVTWNAPSQAVGSYVVSATGNAPQLIAGDTLTASITLPAASYVTITIDAYAGEKAEGELLLSDSVTFPVHLEKPADLYTLPMNTYTQGYGDISVFWNTVDGADKYDLCVDGQYLYTVLDTEVMIPSAHFDTLGNHTILVVASNGTPAFDSSSEVTLSTVTADGDVLASGLTFDLGGLMGTFDASFAITTNKLSYAPGEPVTYTVSGFPTDTDKVTITITAGSLLYTHDITVDGDGDTITTGAPSGTLTTTGKYDLVATAYDGATVLDTATVEFLLRDNLLNPPSSVSVPSLHMAGTDLSVAWTPAETTVDHCVELSLGGTLLYTSARIPAGSPQNTTIPGTYLGTAGTYRVSVYADSDTSTSLPTQESFPVNATLPTADLFALLGTKYPVGTPFSVTFPAISAGGVTGETYTATLTKDGASTPVQTKTFTNTASATSITFNFDSIPATNEGDYFLTVVVSKDGFTAAPSPASVLIVLQSKLATPSFTTGSATNLQEGEDLILSWHAVPGATKYQLTGDGITGTVDLTTTSYTVSAAAAFAANTTHVYKLVALSDTLYTSNEGSTTVTVKPTASLSFSITGNTEPTQDEKLTIYWTPIVGATDYTVTIQPPSPGSTSVLNVGSTTAAGATLGESFFSVLGSYTITVTVWTATGSASDSITFTLKQALGDFAIEAITSPHKLNTVLTAKWSAAANATQYSVVLSLGSTPKYITTVSGGTQVSIPADKFDTAGQYTLTVTAQGTSAYAPRAKTVTFTVSTLGTPVIKDFTTTPRTNVPLNVSWDAVTGAASYKVTLTRPTGLQDLVMNNIASTVNTISFPANYFPVAGTYTITLEAYDGANNTGSKTSAIKTFTVVAGTIAAPVIEQFTTHALNQALTVKWAAVTNATGYTSILTRPDGTQIQGIITGTTATYAASYFQATGTYTVTARAHAADGSYAEASITFQVLPGLAAPVITEIKTHTAGKNLTVKWSAVPNATGYTVILTHPDGTTTQQTINTNTATFDGSLLKATGKYTLKVIASATGYASSEASITINVTKSSGGSGGGSSSGSNARYQTASFKGAFGSSQDRQQSYQYVLSLYDGIRLSQEPEMTVMDTLVHVLSPLQAEWNTPHFNQARQDAMSDYALAYTVMLVNLACTDEALSSPEAIQIITSAVGGILDLLLDPANSLDTNARNAITLLRDRFKAVSASTITDSLPKNRKDVVTLVMSRVLDTLNDDEFKHSMTIVDETFASLMEMSEEMQSIRSLHVAYSLAKTLETSLTKALSELPSNATAEQIGVVQRLYLRYVVALGQLEYIAASISHTEQSNFAQYLAAEKTRLDKVMAAYSTLMK